MTGVSDEACIYFEERADTSADAVDEDSGVTRGDPPVRGGEKSSLERLGMALESGVGSVSIT